jgi:hypothetical protein
MVLSSGIALDGQSRSKVGALPKMKTVRVVTAAQYHFSQLSRLV